MGHACEICGEVLPSHGSLGIHQYSHTVTRPDTPGASPGAGAAPGAAAGVAPVSFENWPVKPPTRRTPGVRPVLALNLCVLLAALASLFVVDGDDASAPATLATEASAGADRDLPPPPEGWEAIDDSDEGFYLTLPSSFEDMRLRGEDVDAMAEMLRPTNPLMAQAMVRNKPMLRHARLFAVEQHSGRNVNLLRMVAGGNATIDDVPEGTFSATYRDHGVADAFEERVQLPAGDAIKVTTVLSTPPVEAHIVQYVLVHDGAVWVLTYTDPSDDGAAVAEAIASSFRFTD